MLFFYRFSIARNKKRKNNDDKLQVSSQRTEKLISE